MAKLCPKGRTLICMHPKYVRAKSEPVQRMVVSLQEVVVK